MPPQEPDAIQVLEPRSSLDMTYNTHGEPLRRYLAAAPGRAGSWLLSWIMPMYATFYTETTEEIQKLGRSFTAALTAARVLNAGRVVYGLMVKTYPASRITSYDRLATNGTGTTDTNTSTEGHYKRIYGFSWTIIATDAFNITGGSISLASSATTLWEMTGDNQLGGTSQNGVNHGYVDLSNCPYNTPTEAGGGEATITLQAPDYDAGGFKLAVELYMEDIIGNPLSE